MLSSLLILCYPFLIFFGLKNLPGIYTLAPVFFFVILNLTLTYFRPDHLLAKKATYIVYFFMLFICLLGLIVKQYDLVKLYPVLMSFSWGGIFIISLRKGAVPMVEKFARQMDKSFSEQAVPYTRDVTKVWVVFFITNAGVSLWTYFQNDLTIWTLYNGVISYILMGLLFAGEYVVRLTKKRAWGGVC